MSEEQKKDNVDQQEAQPQEPQKQEEQKPQENQSQETEVSIDIDKLIQDIELENNKKLDEVKSQAVNEARKGVITEEVLKGVVSKVTEIQSKKFQETIESLNNELSELKEKIPTQKGVMSGVQGNPYNQPAQQQENYNVWNDPNIPDEEKTDLLIRYIRQGYL